MAGLRIGLLGGLRLEADDHVLSSLPQAARSLFSYLAVYPGRRATRDWLIGMIWPDQDETTARKRLSQALWQIQAAFREGGLPDDILAVTNTDVSFHPPDGTWIDVTAFEDAVADADAATPRTIEHVELLERAIAIYEGDLLTGIYDEWIEVERQRLRDRYLDALLDLITDLRSRADHSAALTYARQWAALDVLNESAHAEVMRLCALVGRYNEALQQYRAVEQILETELGVEPSAELVGLRAEVVDLRSRGASPLVPVTSSAPRPVPLIGRESERAAAIEALERAITGRRAAIFVEGESGIGKTRLLQQIASDARWRGFTVIEVECREEELDQPFAAFVRALESGLTGLHWRRLADELGTATISDVTRVLPPATRRLVGVAEPAPLDAAERHDRIASALEAVVGAVGRTGPTLLLIDDAQWIDQPSMDVIAAAEGRLDETPSVLVLGFRDAEIREREDIWARVRAIDALGRTSRTTLGGLSVEETSRLLRDGLLVESTPQHVVAQLHADTAGNPLFMLELVRAAGDNIAALDTAALPAAGGVTDVIRARLDRLHPAEREVVDATAVLARPVSDDELETIIDLPQMRRLEAISALTSAGILVDHEGDFGFNHEQVRRVAVDLIDVERSRTLHLAAAISVERQHPDRVEELARLFAAAHDPDRAATYAIASARRAIGLGSFAAAVDRFDDSDRWMTKGAEVDDRFGVFGEWEEALDVLGRRAEQKSILDRMRELVVDTGMGAEVQRRRALLLANEGHFRDAVATAETAVQASEADAAFLHTFGRVLSQAGRNEDAIEWLKRAAGVAHTGSTEAARIATDLGGTLVEVQRYDEALARLGEAQNSYEVTGDRRGVAEVEGNRAIVFMEKGMASNAIDAYRRALEACRDIGYRRGEAVNLANLANALYFRGLVGEALANYGNAVAAFDAIGDRRSATLVGANSASVKMRLLGDPSVAAEVRRYLTFLESEEHQWGAAFCHEILGAIAVRELDAGQALEHISAGFELLADQQHRWLEAHLEKLAAELGLLQADSHEAAKHIEHAAALCTELGLNDVAPSVGAVAARVALAREQPTRALELAREATDGLVTGAEGPHLVWFSRYLAADAIGESSEALSALRHANRILIELLEDVPEQDRERSLHAVPEHVAILEAIAAHESVAIVISLPRHDVPTGRAIADDEWVKVTLTVSEPTDSRMKGAKRRRAVLLRLLQEADQQGAAPRIGDLAAALDVSEMTVRRDLNALRDDGHNVATRGSRV